MRQRTQNFLALTSPSKHWMIKRNKRGVIQRMFVGVVKVNLSSETVRKKLIELRAVKFTQEKGKRSLETESKNPDDRNETT